MSSSTPQEDFIVTPWDASGKVDYLKLVEKFGTQLIDKPLLEKFQKVINKPLHPWLKRGIFFTHRSFNKFLDAYAEGEPVFLYTGRGPSTEAMHIGHLIPFLFTKWLHDTFDCPLCIQISDEEKAAFKHLDYEPLHQMGFENAKEIISCGFDPKRTFIFSNRDYRLRCKEYENFVSDLKNNVPIKSIKAIFGLTEKSSVAMFDWPCFQSAVSFYQAFPHIFKGRPATCSVPHAIDQDPYFRLARDAASKMNLIKPTNIMCAFIPPLTGNDGKMSSSKADATIFLNDSYETLKEKVMKLCKCSKNLEENMAYQYLRFFEMDDNKLEDIKEKYTKGKMTDNELKAYLLEKLWVVIKEVQENRSKIDDKVMEEFYKDKEIPLPKPKIKEKTKEEETLYNYLDSQDINHSTLYHSVITTKDQLEDLELKISGTICKGVLLKAKEGYVYFIINKNTNINVKVLGKCLGLKNLRFAESDTYQQILKVNSKTCPTPFALINDTKKEIIKVLIDGDIEPTMNVNCLAMREDATCSISYSDMMKIIKNLNYNYDLLI